MIVVSNTSPLINLATVGQLELLEALYGKVIIPQAVYDEIVIEGQGQSGAQEVDQLPWIDVKAVGDQLIVTALEAGLEPGSKKTPKAALFLFLITMALTGNLSTGTFIILLAKILVDIVR